MHHGQSEEGARRAGSADETAFAARSSICFESVTKRFGAFVALDEVNLDIREGEFFALLGPSGCGKTTILRLLAGFERPDRGSIRLGGKDLSDVPPHRRPVNMMFQNYALFPHLTVEANVAFGLRYDGLRRDEMDRRVKEMLALVRLEGLEKRKPHQLSGGQRQRVALARSLAKRPRALLLDEPLAALDRKLRESTQSELVRLQRELGATFIIVTHDQDEAMTLADRMAVMDRGRIVQVGSPRDVYERPNSRYVADFLGDVNLVVGVLLPSGQDRSVVQSLDGQRFVCSQMVEAAPGDAVWLAIRPENLALARTPQPGGVENVFSGTLIEETYRGDTSLYAVRLEGGPVLKAASANAPGARPFRRGERVWVSCASASVIALLN